MHIIAVHLKSGKSIVLQVSSLELAKTITKALAASSTTPDTFLWLQSSDGTPHTMINLNQIAAIESL